MSKLVRNVPTFNRWEQEVFFGTPDGTIMRVEITTAHGVVEAGVPTPWLKLPTLFTHLAFLSDRAAMRAHAPVGQHSAT